MRGRNGDGQVFREPDDDLKGRFCGLTDGGSTSQASEARVAVHSVQCSVCVSVHSKVFIVSKAERETIVYDSLLHVHDVERVLRRGLEAASITKQ